MKITPVLIVEHIERSLPFWIDRLGFTKVVEVPEGDRIAFVILANGKSELMLQTVESLKKDVAAFAPAHNQQRSSLFLEIEDLADIKRRLEGYPIALEERTTFYGMREIGVFDPDGNVLIFAARE